MREFDLIDKIAKTLGRRGERVLRGAGDDAAVVRADGVTATSVEAFVEGVHFRLATTSLRDLGYKCLAASLSDLAAMGASAGEAYLALGLPPNIGEREALELAAGAEELAAEVGVTICGGDLSVSRELFVAVTVVGHAESEQDLVGRDGCLPDDLLGVTGKLGGAGAGLVLLERKEHGLPIDVGERLLERHRRPRPLLAAGQALARAGARAMIDISDGLASDAVRISEQSGVALEIEIDLLPIDDGVDVVADIVGLSAPELAASAGEDYELLVSVPPGERERAAQAAEQAGAPLTWIGTAQAGEGVRLLDDQGRPHAWHGWDHLAAREAAMSPRHEQA